MENEVRVFSRTLLWTDSGVTYQPDQRDADRESFDDGAEGKQLCRAFFFFLIKKEPVAVSNEVPFKPFVSAETVKACALIGLHL